MSTATLHVRRATPADREAVIALSRAVSAHDFIEYGFDDWVAYAEPDGFFVAEQDGRMIGCYCLEFHAEGQAYFFAMRIHPGAQGKGIGTEFCRLQVEQARAAGAREIYLLSVLENLRAHRTVEKNGFVNCGAWLVYDELKQIPPQPPVERARWATVDDGPAIERFRRARSNGLLDGVIASRHSGWAVVTEGPEDWEIPKIAVVDGETGLVGLMLVSTTETGLLLRWLDGTPEAAADLLALLVRRMAGEGHAELGLSLPLSAEPLLVPLGLDPAEAFRAYVFHWTE